MEVGSGQGQGDQGGRCGASTVKKEKIAHLFYRIWFSSVSRRGKASVENTKAATRQKFFAVPYRSVHVHFLW